MHVLMILAAFTLASIGIGVAIFFATRFRRWDALRQMIIKRFGYGVSKPWLLETVVSNSPRFRFRYRGIPSYLKVRSAGCYKSKPAMISFSVDWPERAKAWIVSTEEPNQGRLVKLPLVLHGASPFQKRFFVYSRDLKTVSSLITPPVQHALLQMLTHGRPGDRATEAECMSLHSTRGRLTFRKKTNNNDPQEIEKFMRCCLHIFDQMVLGDVEGVTYLENDLTVIEDVVCPVCSGTIEEDLVLCSSCQSPHCRECWQYNGRCATFACSETDFVTGGVPLCIG